MQLYTVWEAQKLYGVTYALVNFSPVLAGVLIISNVTLYIKCSSGEGGTDGKDLPVPSDGGTYNIGNDEALLHIVKYEAAL